MEQNISLKAFLDGDGKVKLFPQRRLARLAVLGYLAERFVPNRFYTEKEVNAILNAAHTFGDYFLLRRELVDHGLLCRTRDGSQYWKAPIREQNDETQAANADPEAPAEPENA